MSEVTYRIINVLLRLASAGSRFVLLLVLARLLSPTEVGHYGLFLSTVLLGITIIGVEFHAYGIRELLRYERARWSFVIQHDLMVWAIAYVVFAPILWFGSHWWNISGVSLLWFPPILIAEHLCQESNRLLIAMNRPLTASCMMFVRMGAWVWVVIPWMWFDPDARTLGIVMASWLCGASLAVVASAIVIGSEVERWHWWPIEWEWLKRGVGVGALYLISSFAYRGMFAVDRYLVKYLVGSERLGVYVLDIGLATAIITILEPAILVFLTPRLVGAWQNNNRTKYQSVYRELHWSVLGLSTALALGIAVVTPFLVIWIGKPAYAEDPCLLWILLLMVWVCANGITLDTALYARGHDKSLVSAMIATLAVFLITVPALVLIDRGHAVAWGLLVAFTVAYALKYRMLKGAQESMPV